MKKSGSAITDVLPWVILALLLLVILMAAIFVLTGKGTELITWIKNVFRGG